MKSTDTLSYKDSYIVGHMITYTPPMPSPYVPIAPGILGHVWQTPVSIAQLAFTE